MAEEVREPKDAEVKEPTDLEVIPPETVEEPTETPEEMVERLEAENERLSKESQGRLDTIVTLRSKARTRTPEVVQPTAKDPFEGRDPEDTFTVADARAADKRLQERERALKLQTKLDVSIDFAAGQHKDFDEAYANFEEKAEKNPALWGVAYGERNPGEYIYKEGKGTPSVAEVTKEVTKEVVEKIQKPRARLPKGGGGGKLGGPMTMEQKMAIASDPNQWAKLPEAERAKIMREVGSS